MALGAVAALSAACSLLVSVDGLEGGGVGTPGAGGDAEAGPPVTADGGEASAPEASTADGGTWCAAHSADASFCEDFDTLGLARWDVTGEQGGGTAKADTANASSPPVSLLSDLPPIEDAGISEAFVLRRVPVPVTELWASLDVRVEKTSTTGSQLQVVKLLQLDPTTPTDQNAWELGVAVNGTTRKLNVFWYNHYTTDYLDVFVYPTPVAIGAWTRVALHLRLKGALDGAVDVDIDGTRVVSGLQVPSLYAKAPFQLFIGAVYTKVPHDGWTVRTDNVLFDAK
jgi:hypothetical protein